MPCDYKDYPEDWQAKRERKLEQAGHRCQGSPRYPDCRAENHQPHPEKGFHVKLALCHFDHDVTNNEDENLRIWCQRCHLYHDRHQHARSRRYGRNHERIQIKIKFKYENAVK